MYHPVVGTQIKITAVGVVTAYDAGSDSVQLNSEECWWPYNGDGVTYEYLSEHEAWYAELTRLRAENAQLREVCRIARGETVEAPE